MGTKLPESNSQILMLKERVGVSQRMEHGPEGLKGIETCRF